MGSQPEDLTSIDGAVAKLLATWTWFTGLGSVSVRGVADANGHVVSMDVYVDGECTDRIKSPQATPTLEDFENEMDGLRQRILRWRRLRLWKRIKELQNADPASVR